MKKIEFVENCTALNSELSVTIAITPCNHALPADKVCLERLPSEA